MPREKMPTHLLPRFYIVDGTKIIPSKAEDKPKIARAALNAVGTIIYPDGSAEFTLSKDCMHVVKAMIDLQLKNDSASQN